MDGMLISAPTAMSTHVTCRSIDGVRMTLSNRKYSPKPSTMNTTTASHDRVTSAENSAETMWMKRSTIIHGAVGGAMTGSLLTIRSRASGTASSNGTAAPTKSGTLWKRTTTTAAL